MISSPSSYKGVEDVLIDVEKNIFNHEIRKHYISFPCFEKKVNVFMK
jgi:hypothetical protein